MKKRSAFIIAASLALAGCGFTAESQVKDAVRKAMTDPDSAKFGEITIVDGNPTSYACVSVNGKNAFGGYTGEQQVSVAGLGAGANRRWMAGEFASITHRQCVGAMKDLAKGL